MTQDYHDDHLLARDLASAAGDLLLDLRAGLADVDPKERRRLGDSQSNAFLLDQLARRRPDDSVLSEEAKDDLARLDASRVWIVDPLDGTREFSELERDDWAVHVALAVDGELVAGAVALPAQERVLDTAEPPTIGPRSGVGRIVVSRTRPPDWAATVAEKLDAELVPMGSAGAKTAAVVGGSVDMYLHGGGMYEWDAAAPFAVAVAAGLRATRLDGSPLRCNQRDPYVYDLIVCRPELYDAVRDVLP